MKNYTIFHLHSDLSSGVTNIDSVTKYKQYIAKAKECGIICLYDVDPVVGYEVA